MASSSDAPTNPLSSTAISVIISKSLPSQADPQLKTPLDAIAIGTHACLLSVGFRLVGLGEEGRVDKQSEASDVQELPSDWNSDSSHHAFRYKHNQSSMQFLVKINKLGSKAVILAMGIGDDKTVSFDFALNEFTSAGNLPASPGKQDDVHKAIGNVFISPGRIADFGMVIRLKLIQKLVPGMTKAGYTETQDLEADATEDRRRGPRPSQPERDPLRDDRPRIPLSDPLAHPRRPMPEPMPGFEDEHEIFRPVRGPGGFGGPRYGERDLYPAGLGPNDPLRGGVGPGLSPMGGGMHPTFDDPLFSHQGQRGNGYGFQAPPGARYDDVGPGAGHPRGAGMGGRPPNPFGGFGSGDFI